MDSSCEVLMLIGPIDIETLSEPSAAFFSCFGMDAIDG